MRFFTSQRPGLWILIVSCLFGFRFRDFFLFFFSCCFSSSFSLFVDVVFCFAFCFLLVAMPCLMCCHTSPTQVFQYYDILRLNMSAKHSCKNTEYETFDFGSSGPNRTPTQKGKMNMKEIGRKQDPNAEGKNDHEKKRKNNTKKMIKKTGPPRASLKKNKNLENQEKPRILCAFFAFFFAFFLRVFCVFPLRFFLCFFLRSFCVFFGVFLVFFLLFFSPLPRGRCFCARRPWRRKSLM